MTQMFHQALGTFTSSPKHTLGQEITVGNKTYRYVQFKDAVTYVEGHSLEYADTGLTTVTNDRAGGSSLGRISAGALPIVNGNVPTEGQYGWFQTKGPATLLTSGADDIAVGEAVFCHATTDGTCDGASASTFSTGNLGVAVAADVDAANTVLVMLNCM